MPPIYSREIHFPLVFGRNIKTRFRTSPCEEHCPAGNSIQKVQTLVEAGAFDQALRYLRARNPFPGITGRVCPHFCQNACNRSGLDDCVNIRALERAVYDYATPGMDPFKPRPATGKRVAIVGGGPAGLTAAYFSALLGHEVTLYEASPMLGGVPRHGIPAFRLPRDVVDREVGRVLNTGVRALVNTRIGKDTSLAELQKESDAVILATGAPREHCLSIPHADYAWMGGGFLYKTALGLQPPVGKRVVIMGGGGVAFDCAFTARRLGAEEVHIFCLEREGELRAPVDDVHQARQENIAVHTGCTLSALEVKDGTVTGAAYYEVLNSSFDERGGLSLEPKPGSNHILPCDTVIFAVGMRADLTYLDSLSGTNIPATTPRGFLQVDGMQASTAAGIFAAGDVASGPSSVAAAVGSGRQAAFGVHGHLMQETARVFGLNEEGMIVSMDHLAASEPPHVVSLEEIYGAYSYESVPTQVPPVHVTKTFAEQCLGLKEEAARQEASRCMHCGHCKACGTCVEDCPGYVLKMADTGGQEQPEVAFGEECWHCANCRTSCPCGAIAFQFPLRMQV